MRGGCTTHSAFELARALEGVDLIGPPRLVRLNPNIPHKTRGNGAVVLRLGHGRGGTLRIGHDAERPLLAYSRGDPLGAREAEAVFDKARRLIERTARLDDPKTNPGLVACEAPPPPGLYEAAVHRYVGRREAMAALRACGARFAGWKDARGLVGAAAAAAWPGLRGTFEWIVYRQRARWGTPRDLDPTLGPQLDRGFPTTFDNYDAPRRHLRVAPASPCPILAGIRGTAVEDLARAARLAGPEPQAGSLLFATNQATDDHLAPALTGALRPFEAVTLTLRVDRRPATWRGGHVFVRASDATGTVDLAAFEPTKEFRHAVRSLAPGDVVCAHGGVHADPTLVALEKFEVLETAPLRLERPPACPVCGRRMASRGRGAGYRCPLCRARSAAPETIPGAERGAGPFEVPVLVRRHLSRPLGLRQLARRPVGAENSAAGR